MPMLSDGQHSVHIIKPNLQWCSCGIRQDYLYPCHHTCAVYQKWYERDFQYFLQNHVHWYYTFKYVQKMYKQNIFPVCVDTINYDRATKPPIVHGRQQAVECWSYSQNILTNKSQSCSNNVNTSCCQ